MCCRPEVTTIVAYGQWNWGVIFSGFKVRGHARRVLEICRTTWHKIVKIMKRVKTHVACSYHQDQNPEREGAGREESLGGDGHAFYFERR